MMSHSTKAHDTERCWLLLHNRRKRLADLARREAAGESFWTEKFDQAARTKITFAFQNAVSPWPDYYVLARAAILHNEGRFHLTRGNVSEDVDLLTYLMTCSDDMVPTVIEAMAHACSNSQLNMATGIWHKTETFNPSVSVILREHRISYELVNGEMISLSNMELHDAVVAPAVKLLAGRTDLSKVENAYLGALGEITSGKAADAITDAGTSLQEMLVALGCTGNALGPLIKSAKAKGLLAPHDSPMVDAVEKILHWVSADRSETGDAHMVTSPDLDDAWFAVHVVGAIILRLSKPSVRGTSAN
jgi:hypothetical protein